MPGQSRAPSQSQGAAPVQDKFPKAPAAAPASGVGNAEVAASIGKGGTDEASGLLTEPALKPGAAAPKAPEAKAPAAKAPAPKAPAPKAADPKSEAPATPKANAPKSVVDKASGVEEEKAAPKAQEKSAKSTKGDADPDGKAGDKAAGKGGKDLKADKSDKVAKGKDAGPADKGGGDGPPPKADGGPPKGEAPPKGEKGGNPGAAFNSGLSSGPAPKSGGPSSPGASAPAPSTPAPSAPTGGAPTGGSGGGGGGGGASGGSSVGSVAQEAAVAVEIPAASDLKGTFSNFATAAPSQQANAWPTLGTDLAAKGDAESKKLDDSVPVFRAVMKGDGQAGGGTTGVKAPGMPGALDGETGGPVPDAVMAPTVDPGVARYNTGIQAGVSRLPQDAADDVKARAIASGIGSIQTSDGAVTVSPGPAPVVPLSGDSDPSRLGTQTASMSEEAATALSEARDAVVASPGAELVQPLELDVPFEVPALEMATIEATPEVGDMQKFVEQALPSDIQASFDEIHAPEFTSHLAEANTSMGDSVDTRDLESQNTLDKASADNEKLAADAQATQESAVSEQRSAITSKREETMAAQAAAVADVRGQANDASMAEQRRVDTRIAQDNSKIESEFTRAEREAADEVTRGEREAAEKKRKAEEEANNKSWWEKACDWVASALEALASVLNALFDAIRSAVTAILDAVKSVANAIIDAAVSFIKDAIAALGSLLKGLIQGLLGDIFPGLADALCGFVDSAVKFVQEQVQKIGDKLKEAVAAACDAVAGALNKILDVFQAAVNTAIAIAQAAITGDWNLVLIKMLEAALRIVGVSPEEFYAYVGKAEDTIQIILDDPGNFIGNIIEAVGMGFGQFGDNFIDHLQNGFVGWLTGQAGDTGIKMPGDPMSLGGIFDMATQVLGVTPDAIEGIAKERLGEENVEQIQFVWGFIESAIAGGMDGLWEHIQGFLDGIYDQVIGAIQSWLMEKVVMAAITKIATMWNPVGAIIQAITTAWNVYQWLQAQAARIMGIVKSVVDGMHDIATGALGGAANMVENALAGLVPVAIDLLASLLGVSGVGKKVKGIIEGIRGWVHDAINKLIDKVLGMFTGGKDKKKEGEAPAEGATPDVDPNAPPPDIGHAVPFSAAGQSHRVFIEVQGNDARVMVASTVMTAEEHLQGFEARANAAPVDPSKPSIKDQALPVIARARQLAASTNTHADTLAQMAPEKREAQEAAANATVVSGEQTIAECFTTLFTLFGDTGASADSASLATKLAGVPEAAQIAPLLTLGTTPAELAVMLDPATTAAQLRKMGHEKWRASVGETTYIKGVVDAFGDATAIRKLEEVNNDKQLPATFITAFRKDLADRIVAASGAGIDKFGIYDRLMQEAAKPYTKKGNDFQLNATSMYRVQGVDGTWGANGSALSNDWQTRVKAGLTPARATAWDTLDAQHKDTLAREKFKLEAGKSNVNTTDTLKFFQAAGGNIGGDLTWWTSTDVGFDFSKVKSGVDANKAGFEYWCQMGALQGAWYPGGLMKFMVPSAKIGAALKKPTAMDGMMSPYWVQCEGNDFAGMTGGGETEWVMGAPPMSVATGLEMAVTGNTFDQLATSWLDNGERVAKTDPKKYDRAVGSAGQNDYDKENQAFEKKHGNEAIIQGTVPEAEKNSAVGQRNEAVGSPTRQRQGEADATGGASTLPMNGANGDAQVPVVAAVAPAPTTPVVPPPAVAGTPEPAVDPKKGDPAKLPHASYVDAKGDSHELFFKTAGPDATIMRASTTPAPVGTVVPPGTSTFDLKDAIEGKAKEYLKATDPLVQQRLLDEIKALITQLRVAMAAARGEGPDAKAMLTMRLALEQQIGLKAESNKEAKAAASDMAAKAIAMIQTDAAPALAAAKGIDKALIQNADFNTYEPFRVAIKSMGMDLNSGFFGAVGKSYDAIMFALTKGEQREKIQHLINFGGGWLGNKVFSTVPPEMEALLVESGLAATNVKMIMDRKKELEAKAATETDPKKKAGLTTGKELMGDTSKTPEFLAAKDSKMDKKFPTVPLESLSDEQLHLLAQRMIPDISFPKYDKATKTLKNKAAVLAKLKEIQTAKAKGPVGLIAEGESNPMTQSEASRDSVNLSSREERAHGLNEDVLPYLEGMQANMVDTNNTWIKAARDMSMPIRAGISGNTHRWMNLAGLLGVDSLGARMCMIGHLIPTNAHSFHEIMVAAQPAPYNPGHYYPLEPLSYPELKAAAMAAGSPEDQVDAVLNKE